MRQPQIIDRSRDQFFMAQALALAPEQGGPKGPEPTRFGDWERKGVAVDF